MPEFNEFLRELKESVIGLVQVSWSDYHNEAIKDGESFLTETKHKIEKWTRLLAGGDLTLDQFERLIRSQKDLAEMKALERAGMTAVRVDRFRNALVDTVVNTTIKCFL